METKPDFIDAINGIFGEQVVLWASFLLIAGVFFIAFAPQKMVNRVLAPENFELLFSISWSAVKFVVTAIITSFIALGLVGLLLFGIRQIF